MLNKDPEAIGVAAAGQFKGALTSPTSDARSRARLASNAVTVVAFASAANEISVVGNAHIVNS